VTLDPGDSAVFLPINGIAWTLYASTVFQKGWLPVTETWTRTGNHTFTVVGDLTAKYRKSTKVRYKDGGSYEYGTIQSVTYGAPNTTITLVTNTDYAMAAATITDTYLSYIDRPEGFPIEFNWTVTWTNLTVNNGTVTAKFCVLAGMQINYHIELVFGSSTSISGAVDHSLPVPQGTYGGASASKAWPIGLVRMLDTSAPAAYQGIDQGYNGSVGNIVIQNASGTYLTTNQLSSTVPFTWAVGDEITIQGSYFGA